MVEVPLDRLDAEAGDGVDIVYLCEGVDVKRTVEVARKHAFDRVWAGKMSYLLLAFFSVWR